MDSLLASPVTLGLLVLNVAASLIAFSNPAFMQQNILWVGPMRKQGEWYRALSSGFLHVNGPHLMLNMYGLWLFGPICEYVLGGVGFAIVYLASLLGGSAWAYLHNQNSPEYRAAGASGALSGMILAFCLFQPFAVLLAFFVIPMWGIVFGVLYIALSYVFAMRADRIIGHEAHLGGAVVGVIATLLVRPETWSDFTAQLADKIATYAG
ncbi:MAG: rhomboid family intramembrane serine protease [Hyphomonas sp.]|uniref:rhomboid family intramembrane serine protease n=1 Tax=Hyphomonas sp. TaxID=87 RepID=UPI00182EE543|nr:rhomboid family intramembrane serine protease [Hyphomonas sp.]MBU3919288.1 rhomboid family intramembrane serine protease [Alphaproteobacteria bacterium]MBA3068491.1 rhomboid family intramembrane serine protease [Hyphomonas sp.]MBU4060642.1 rhomboid family intramembrane serine protease [Alphaproteobacteria bacterium]MBU4164626.1 rhomboid family intramembrane serine protease [Alphaproteobacteria bacterium]MBU4567706.1 rhomboid family intramembrane serine protease [Alphaproteobacteria bacteriu